MIRKVGSKWVLFSQDGKKRLGEHDTEAKAEAQERAVQASKHRAAEQNEDLEIRELYLLSATGTVRAQMHQGREHLVVPVVALMEGVIHAVNADEPEFVPYTCLEESLEYWAGMPVVVGHPTKDGVQISAHDPDVLKGCQFGTIYQAHGKDGQRLGLEAWVDPQRLEELDELELLEDVRAGNPIEVSIGGYVRTLAKLGEYNGKAYKSEWKSLRPDHLAFLPRSKGACSIEMGCGAHRAAQQHGHYELTSEGLRTLAPMADKAGITKDCPSCDGTGKLANGEECTTCMGHGKIRTMGGAGSGNFGHGGRPGERGGSSSGDGGSSRDEQEHLEKYGIADEVAGWLEISDDRGSYTFEHTARTKEIAQEHKTEVEQTLQDDQGFESTGEGTFSTSDGGTATVTVSGKRLTVHLKGTKPKALGGKGSGNWGHGGRPGERGGSSSEGGGGGSEGATSGAWKKAGTTPDGESVYKLGSYTATENDDGGVTVEDASGNEVGLGFDSLDEAKAAIPKHEKREQARGKFGWHHQNAMSAHNTAAEFHEAAAVAGEKAAAHSDTSAKDEYDRTRQYALDSSKSAARFTKQTGAKPYGAQAAAHYVSKLAQKGSTADHVQYHRDAAKMHRAAASDHKIAQKSSRNLEERFSNKNFRAALGTDREAYLAAEQSLDDKMQAVSSAVERVFNPQGPTPNVSWVWPQRIYDNYVILRKDNKLYRCSYTRDADGVVTIGDEMQEVKLKEEFVAAETNPAGGGGSAAEQGDKDMTKEARQEMIAHLSSCDCSGFTKADLKVLEGMSDERLEQLKTHSDGVSQDRADKTKYETELRASEVKIKTLETRKQMTEEEVLKAYPSIRALVEKQQTADTEKKTTLVESLKAAQDAYTEDELKAMDLVTLEKTAKMLGVGEHPHIDFSTARGIPRAASAKDSVFLNPPNPYDEALKAKREGKAKASIS